MKYARHYHQEYEPKYPVGPVDTPRSRNSLKRKSPAVESSSLGLHATHSASLGQPGSSDNPSPILPPPYSSRPYRGSVRRKRSQSVSPHLGATQQSPNSPSLMLGVEASTPYSSSPDLTACLPEENMARFVFENSI